MSLWIVATPIGCPRDLGQRAIEKLRECDLVIGEEKKPTINLLRIAEALPKEIELLNEHSDSEDLQILLNLTRKKNVVLVTDCGTPGFCDPGADLVRLCRESNIKVHSVPGPSSLSCFLSLCGKRLDRFIFEGFLPRDRKDREKWYKSLSKQKVPVIFMDTPYRLAKVMDELKFFVPKHNMVLGVELSKEQEDIIEGLPAKVAQKIKFKKAEFLILIEPTPAQSSLPSRSRRVSK